MKPYILFIILFFFTLSASAENEELAKMRAFHASRNNDSIIQTGLELEKKYSGNDSVLAICHMYMGIAYSLQDYLISNYYLELSQKEFERTHDFKNKADYAFLLRCRFDYYHSLNQISKSHAIASELKSVSKSVFGENSEEYAIALFKSACSNCKDLYEATKELEQAVIVGKDISINPQLLAYFENNLLQIQQERANYEAICSDHIDPDNNILAVAIYAADVARRYDIAINLFSKAIEEIETQNPINLHDYCIAYSRLSECYINQGQTNEAYKVIDKALTKVGSENDDSYLLLNATSQLFISLVNPAMTRKFATMAKIQMEEKGNRGIEYIKCLNNLAEGYGMEYASYNAKRAALLYNNQAIELSKNIPIYQHLYRTLLNNKASIYSLMDSVEAAKKCFEQIKEINTPVGENDTKWLVNSNLAALYLKNKEYVKAQAVMDELSLDNSPNAKLNWLNYYDLKICSELLSNNTKARTTYYEFCDKVKQELPTSFANFSQDYLEKYWTTISVLQNTLGGMIVESFKTDYDKRELYNSALFTKSMLQLSDNTFVEMVKNSGNDTLINQLKELNDKKKALYSKNCGNKIQLNNEIQHLEFTIKNSIPEFAEKLGNKIKKIDDVRSNLSENEAAIEFIVISNTLDLREYSDIMCALIITKDTDTPILVHLCDINELDYIIGNIGQKNVNSLYTNQTDFLYKHLWEPIEKNLDNVRTIYYAPSGAINFVNLAAIPLGNGMIVGDKYSVYAMTSTSKIEDLKKDTFSFRTASLWGGIRYDTKPEKMIAEAANYLLNDGSMAMRGEQERGSWDYLPGTLDEINSIQNLLEKKNIPSITTTGTKANEESFKALDGHSTDILHVATHGFYLDSKENIQKNSFAQSLDNDIDSKESSLQYCGLLFSGANNKWMGYDEITQTEDGILTADEISKLDLRNTKLVVLSACKTGLGHADNIDGVFGLQRGLKKAGVGSILVSLWNVSDDTTVKLMTLFYQYLLDGNNPHKALALAQSAMRTQYKDPYYWAGFIVLD